MEARSLPVRKLARVLIAMSCILLPVAAPAQSASTRPLIALFEPFGPKADTTLAAALSTVADSVELDLTCLQRFDVRRLPARDPARDMGSVRSYCRANRIDQAILGSGISQASGGYAFTLMLYDRRTDAVTMVQEGACSGALDMFDTTDTLVAALLDKLSGEHLLFGALVIETDPPGAVVTLNGKELGASPLSLRGLPVGPVTVSARSPGWEEGSSTVKVEDNQTSSISLKLARSMGTLRLDMPEDAYVTVRSADVPERILWGPTSEELPTGSYQLEATCPGLATVRQGITVARDSTVSFRPWEKGYLEVRPDVDGVSVSVDGTPRGTAPLVLEM
ncbi:MAG TPA: PEGA domain-containing protein, partial [bacterium]|nr:PEGA domain-containing protein [bacterium]